MADVVKKATREAYGAALVPVAEDFPELVVLDADLAGATKTGTFKKAYPDRFFDCGIAEGNMMSIAAGLAASGKKVFASSFAMFAAGRAFEQVRNAIGYTHLNVKIGATHAGISVGEDGATHQCCEDVALMRSIPGMTIICPTDEVQTHKAIRAALEMNGPVYVRLGRSAVPAIYDETHEFEIGRGYTLREGTDVTLIGSGLLVSETLEAAELLQNEGISARVIDMPTIKPLDRDLIVKAAYETGAIVTAEDHSVIGGLGGAVAELICQTVPVPVLRIGVQDMFGKSGAVKELMKKYELDAASIAAKAKEAVKMKK